MSSVNRNAEQLDLAVENGKWWGEYELPEGRWCRWRIGVLTFFARRGQNDWHFAWMRGNDLMDATLERGIPSGVAPDLESSEQTRYVMDGAGSVLQLRVCLAERPVIARPEIPLFVPAGHHVMLYVSTGLWLQPCIGDMVVAEVPVYRLSDTWFGPDTRSGELCYASLTRARSSIEGPDLYPFRAVTPIDVVNQGTDPLRIEQLRVPVPLLALHVDEDGRLLTDAIALKRGEGETQASLEIPQRRE